MPSDRGPAECHIPHPLLTSCLPLSFPPVPLCHSRKFLAGIQKKEKPHSPSPFAARFRLFACLGVAHRQGRDALPKRECGWKRGKEQTPTGLNHQHPHGSPFSGFPLKTCGNDRKGDYGNDRRGDCGNACPAACPRCLLRLSFPTLVIGNPLL